MNSSLGLANTTIDKTAPIIACGGAASIILGLPLEIAVPNAEKNYTSEEVVIEGIDDTGVTRYRSDSVDFWTDRDTTVFRVMVHDEYKGKFLERIGIGSLLRNVEQWLGSISVIDESVTVRGLLGISFEVEADQLDSQIIEIYVWTPDYAEIMAHQTQ
jgi:hypothetical protein